MVKICAEFSDKEYALKRSEDKEEIDGILEDVYAVYKEGKRIYEK